MTTDRQRISSGSTFEERIGYSRAVISGDTVFVSGTTGFDYATMTLPEGIVDQCEHAVANIVRALEQAGATLRDVVRVRYILPALRLSDEASLEQLKACLQAAGVLTRDDNEIEDSARFFADNPWGNRLEFVAPRQARERP